MRLARNQDPSYRWWVFGGISIGTFITVVDQGSVNVALPTIETHFQATLPAVQWIVVGYALAISVMLLPMGRLGDLFNRKQVYIVGLAVFSLGAGLAGVAPNIPLLVLFKVLQGIGAAMVQGNGVAAIISVFPGAQRGKTLGLNLSVVGTGSIVGPTIGGVLVSALGWRSVFFLSASVGLIGFAVCSLVLDKQQSEVQRVDGHVPKFDWAGAVLSSGALLILLLAINNGHGLGWTSPLIVFGFVGACLLLTTFIWWELRCPAPMMDVRLFQRKLVVFGVLTGWISFMSNAATVFLMPFYLQSVLGYSPGVAGLIVLPAAVFLTLFGGISGHLSDRLGWRRFTVGGMALSAAGLFILGTRLSVASPLAFIIPVLVLRGSGVGMFNSPNNSSILSAVERSKYGVVSALTQLTRNTANVTSVSLATAVVTATMSARGLEPRLDQVSVGPGSLVAQAFVTGIHRTCLILGGLLVLGLALSLFRGGRTREEEPEAAVAVPAERARDTG